jgi:uncharacterized protein
MSPQYLSPGVYVEEVERGARPIEGVGTAVAAFVGFAEKGPVNQPSFIANWTQYTNTFGGFIPGGYMSHAVYGYFHNGGGGCYITRLPGGDGTAEAAPVQALLPARGDRSISSLVITSLEAGIPTGDITVEVMPASEGAPEDQFNLVFRHGAAIETYENLTLRKAKGARNVIEVVNKDSKLVRLVEKESTLSVADKAPVAGKYALTAASSTAIGAVTPDTIVGNAAARSGIAGFEAADDVTMVCVPDLMALFKAGKITMEGVKSVQQALLDHCANMKDRFAILDCPPGMNPQDIKEWRMKDTGYDSKYGALYYPWIKVTDPLGGSDGILVPPCGHMAGIYARSDTERGVHKAPANEVVRGVIGLETKITKVEQDSLNPVGVNCIRPFSGRGIRIWGARTLASDALWRYINVRRLFNFVEKSIEIGTQWVVFEPNDRDLWERIKRDITAFLTRVWRDGALFGATPEEAFYVKCDDEINTVEIRDAGQVIIEIGIAPVKPAEFVIFRLSQWSGGAAVSE